MCCGEPGAGALQGAARRATARQLAGEYDVVVSTFDQLSAAGRRGSRSPIRQVPLRRTRRPPHPPSPNAWRCARALWQSMSSSTHLLTNELKAAVVTAKRDSFT